MSALQKILNMFPGYPFREATERLVFGPLTEADRLGGVPNCAWNCPAARHLLVQTGAEYAELCRTGVIHSAE